jgi:outer membrane protein assembly factor BamB
MRVVLATLRMRWAVLLAGVSILCCANGISRGQQPGVLIFGGAPPQIELTAPQVNEIPGSTASRLEQARAIIASGNLEEAVNIYDELAADGSDRVAVVAPDRYVSLQTYCNLQLARLPAEGLAAYRRRVDPLAKRLYEDGIAKHDTQRLQRVVDATFCSSWGDDALLAMGDLALERADYDGARRAWEQISPQLRDPRGGSMWHALAGIDLDANWAEIARRWQSRSGPPDWLAYPDTSINLADIRARLLLASIRAGQLDRAALELKAFRHWHPDAIGKIGGQEATYVDALEKLLSGASEWTSIEPPNDWPTFAGAQTRSPSATALGLTLVPVWERPISLSPPAFRRRVVQLVQGGAPPKNSRDANRPLSCYPVVSSDLVIFADAEGVHACSATTGRPALVPAGTIYRNESRQAEQQQGALPPVVGADIAQGVPRLSLNIFEQIAYARVGNLTTSAETGREVVDDYVVGLDLRREGLLTTRLRPDDGSWSFDGTPVSDGRRLYVAMRRGGATPHAYVASFDGSTGGELWRTSIGSADTPASNLGGAITHNLLTLAGNRIYFNTNLGIVAALDAESGKISWLTKYSRSTGKRFVPGSTLPRYFDRDPSPCMYHDGLVIVAPSDTSDVFALDGETGKTVWTNSEVADATTLLGIVGGKLIASGDRLSSLDFRTGRLRWSWPESSTAGIRGIGRGAVAGTEVFWPTRAEIHVVDADSGTRTRPPISLSPVSDCGANLAVGDGRLIVAGYDKLLAFGAPSGAPKSNQRSTPTEPIRTGRLSPAQNSNR